ncbi:ATP-binding protein [Nonomuraea sp. NPDC003804]|uniref:ATP-binding protein n=1 Tax=Nonomuraea sp. NPDC003804 TaxID=3154547 RepID=UPI0033B0A4B3
MVSRSWFEVPPSAARLTGSLRDIGYDFPTAVADIVDNSISAGAKRVDVLIEFDGLGSRVFIVDDGVGMKPRALEEALRFGSRRKYQQGDLGRYGLGLKTASLSQCRSVTVATRSSTASTSVHTRELDFDLIEEWDQWVVAKPPRDVVLDRCRGWLAESAGTVVVWRNLDRVLPEKRPEGGWARRRLESLAVKTAEHLGAVFHRHLEGAKGHQLVITVNGEKVRPWNPFAPEERHRQDLPPLRFEVQVGELCGSVTLRRYILPTREKFSTPEEFDRLSGPLNWNRQQGLYVYRADRLVQWGGWAGIRGIDEHTKLARASIDFDTDLDSVFNIDVAKMRVTLPPSLRQLVEPAVNELCVLANGAYRKAPRKADKERLTRLAMPREEQLVAGAVETAGVALRTAAMLAGEYAALTRIIDQLRLTDPESARLLGLHR